MGRFDFMPSFEGKKKELKGSINWKNVKEVGKVAGLLALLSLPIATEGFSSEKEKATDGKTKLEQLKEKAAGNIKDLSLKMLKKCQEGKMGQTSVRKWESPDKQTVSTVGYSGDGKTPQFIISESGDGTMRFFDDKADGSLDRVVVNKSNPKFGARQKRSENDLKTFDSLDNLAGEAEVTAGLEPEDVKVYEIMTKDGIVTFRSVDFNSGEATELSGPDAQSLATKVQSSYTSNIEQLDSQLGK